MPKDNRLDITDYSAGELSMLVFNTEGLYRIRNRSDLKEILEETFIFTKDQWEELQQDIQDDLED